MPMTFNPIADPDIYLRDSHPYGGEAHDVMLAVYAAM